VRELANWALKASKAVQANANFLAGVPDEGHRSYSQQVLPNSLARNTRGYIEKIVNQINGCCERGWFDACAVMIRRLLETLLIECFEQNNLASKVKTSSGDFLYLGGLIDAALSETSWNLGRNTRRILPKLKGIGDQSAHSRRFTARRSDIDKVKDDLRIAVEELLFLGGLK
jgi:hypothetical protein